MADFGGIYLEQYLVSQYGSVIPLGAVDGVTVRSKENSSLLLLALIAGLVGIMGFAFSPGRNDSLQLLTVGAAAFAIACVLIWALTRSTLLVVHAGNVSLSTQVKGKQRDRAVEFARQVAAAAQATLLS